MMFKLIAAFTLVQVLGLQFSDSGSRMANANAILLSASFDVLGFDH
jgi:hypothetical protein